MFSTRLLSLVLACSFLWGGPTGCVTIAMIESVVEEGEGAGYSPGAGEVAARVGLVGLLLPLTLSADLVIAVTFGWLIYDEVDDDEDDDHYYQHEPPPGPTDCAKR